MIRTPLVRAAFAVALIAALTTTQPSFAAPLHPQHGSRYVVAGAKRLSSTPAPRISGSGHVGAVLKAVTDTWKPGHVVLQYQWRSDGHLVSRATSSRFTIRGADAGRSITVVVRGSRHGYRTVTRTSRPLRIAAASSAPTAPSSPPVVVAPTPTSNVAIAGSGSYRVGSSVAAGTYVTTSRTTLCYWSRVSSFDGQFSSIIDNDLGSGQRIITILPTDYGVTFSSCGTWVRVGDAPAVGAVQDGVYLVGSQVPAGEYEATASDGCYWATLSDFTGDLDAIIANDSTDSGSVIVDIPSTAVGFTTSGCGTWTRVG